MKDFELAHERHKELLFIRPENEPSIDHAGEAMVVTQPFFSDARLPHDPNSVPKNTIWQGACSIDNLSL